MTTYRNLLRRPALPWARQCIQLGIDGWFAGAPRYVRSNPEAMKIDSDFATLPCAECGGPSEYHPFHSHEKREFDECGYRVFSVCLKCENWSES
jgi:hypothetical protein